MPNRNLNRRIKWPKRSLMSYWRQRGAIFVNGHRRWPCTCQCGCGLPFIGHRQQKYPNRTHRSRAARQVREENGAAKQRERQPAPRNRGRLLPIHLQWKYGLIALLVLFALFMASSARAQGTQSTAAPPSPTSSYAYAVGGGCATYVTADSTGTQIVGGQWCGQFVGTETNAAGTWINFWLGEGW
jgi:hypothetical protein